MRVLVTGADGMLGQAVCEEAPPDCEIISLSRRNRGEKNTISFDLNTPVTFSFLDAQAGAVDAVIHCAAKIPHSAEPFDESDRDGFFRVNVLAVTELACWAARRDAFFVHVSGANVYRNPYAEKIRETAATGITDREDIYASTKYLGESSVISLLKGKILKGVVLRPSSIFGPGLKPAKFISRVLSDARAGRVITLTPPVTDKVNLVYSYDVAHAVWLAVRSGKSGIYNIAGPENVSFTQIAWTAVEVCGGGSQVTIDESCSADRPPRTRYDLDCSKAARSIGYKARYSLKDAFEHLLSIGPIP